MLIKTVKISEKGQIAIPHSIRENLSINRGDELIVVQMDNKILIEKSSKLENAFKDEFKDVLKFSERSLKEVWDNEEDEVWSKFLKK